MNIKELRKASGMTQKAFAAYFDIPKRTIENWEQGINDAPQYLVELIEYKLLKEQLIPTRYNKRSEYHNCTSLTINQKRSK